MALFRQQKKRPYALIILDGWGIAPVWGGNAIAVSHVKTYNDIIRKFPFTMLGASDGAVGLPLGAPGNSEAGHLNIGAGEVVHQDQPIIDETIECGSFFSNKTLLGAIDHARKNHSRVHLTGLLSHTGTHSQIDHLFALLKLLKQQEFSDVYIHLFADGRDSDVMSGIEMVDEVEQKIKENGVGQISTIIGRYFAMDRDENWNRIKLAYDLLVLGKGKNYISSGAVFTASYAAGTTDEFIEPSLISDKGSTAQTISNNDAVIFFNFRADRARELTRAFTDPNLSEYQDRKKLENLYFASFVMYGEEKGKVYQVFAPYRVNEPLASIWSKNGLRQFRTAETEKYAHITYFFNGGVEAPYSGEQRMMVPSPKTETYDKIPEMNAGTLTNNLISIINRHIFDCLVVNFANADMVGHTGNFKAACTAVEYIDHCLNKLLIEILRNNGVAFIFADHGNAEQMVNPKTGAPDTEHTTNPVPFAIVSNDPALQKISLRKDGRLASIAPTVLDIMGLNFISPDKDKSLIIRERNENQ